MTPERSILVCRLSALGDVVLSLPVVHALRDRYPRAHLAFLSREPYGRVLRSVEQLDELHLWKGKGAQVPAAIRDRSWDVVVDLSATGRSRSLLRGVRARRRLRARKQSLRRFAFVRLRALGADSASIASAADRLFSAVEPLGLVRDGREPRFAVKPPPPDGPILVAPGGGRETKRWPASRFAEVVRHAVDGRRRVLVLGTREEEPLLRTVAAGVSDPDRVEILPGPDPSELPAIVARCPVGLTNDSGLLHVAEACGVRVVAIFGPTHPGLGFGPVGPKSVAVHSGIACSPCDVHGPARCPKGHHRCMNDISVAEVLRALGGVPAP